MIMIVIIMMIIIIIMIIHISMISCNRPRQAGDRPGRRAAGAALRGPMCVYIYIYIYMYVYIYI